MVLDLVGVSIAGGILCLDRTVVQSMISRPVVAAPVIGLILGDAYAGLLAGALIELIWIDRLPIGAYIPPNDTIVAIMVTVASIECSRLIGVQSPGLMALSILLALPVGILFKTLEVRLVEGNGKLLEKAISDARRGDVGSIGRRHCTAILISLLVSVACILIATALLIPTLAWIYPRLAPRFVRGLTLLSSIFPLLGAAVALNTITVRGVVPIFCAAFLGMTVIIGFIRGG